jgi:hypothetical protein
VENEAQEQENVNVQHAIDERALIFYRRRTHSPKFHFALGILGSE